MKTFYDLLNIINENLVLKKRQTQDGKFQFVVDSDILDKKLAGNETYKNKNKIKSAGFVWDKSLQKWVSVNSYDQEEFNKLIPEFKRKILSINADFDPNTFSDVAEDLEEYLELGLTDKLKEFLDVLKREIVEASNSPEVQDFMRFTSKFTSRSFNNRILIWIQNRNATHVEGMKTWREKFGRRVKKGSKSIKIWVPIGKKKKIGEEEDVPQKDEKVDETRNLTRFTLGNVFDIADTEPIPGKEHLYNVKEPKWYDDEIPDESTQHLYDALLQLAKENNIKVTISQEGLGGARGVSRKGEIQLMKDNIPTMIHELTHEFLHTIEKRKGIDKNILELQAQVVTNLVLRHYGLPDQFSKYYLALWKISEEDMNENYQVCLDAAKMFIDYISEKIMEVDPISQNINATKTESFREFLRNENVFFGAYVKDGRIFLNINGEKKVVVVDAILHDKIKKMEKQNAQSAYDYILKLINSGNAYFL